MNTREIATEYRLSHWAGILHERNESGLSVKDFCKGAGIHENSYYYWQKKLREAACSGIMKTQAGRGSLAALGFVEVAVQNQSVPQEPEGISQSQVCIEAGRVRITAGGEYPIDKLSKLLRTAALA